MCIKSNNRSSKRYALYIKIKMNLRIYDKSTNRIIEGTRADKQGKREFYPYEICVGYAHFDVNDMVISFGSGLNDVNGTEIFEGDIIACEIRRYPCMT
jgi:hypothetical protein